jgi:hypothetical protein
MLAPKVSFLRDIRYTTQGISSWVYVRPSMALKDIDD